jgi:WD40 repeat protein
MACRSYGGAVRITGTDCHTAYVTCVRYDHKGAFYCTVGSDKAGFIFEGKDGKQVGTRKKRVQLWIWPYQRTLLCYFLVTQVGVLGPEGMHKGSVYSCSWSPDDSMILTTSADKTAKVWAVTEVRPTRLLWRLCICNKEHIASLCHARCREGARACRCSAD